jgi:hypothetical protein
MYINQEYTERTEIQVTVQIRKSLKSLETHSLGTTEVWTMQKPGSKKSHARVPLSDLKKIKISVRQLGY